jgi:hypothetical protein
MLQQYVATGVCVNDCQNGLQNPITGVYVYTGFLDQCETEGKAYWLACENASYLRSLSPCLSEPTTTTTTTSSTTTPMPDTDLLASGDSFYDWTGNFNGVSNSYYDIVSWGQTEGYLSGNTYGSNRYFSYLSANDVGGYGVVLAVIKGSGVTGFGNNTYNQLDIPAGLTNVKQVSVGYDHVLALRENGTITGWGRDNWGALNFNSRLNGINVRKVCAGVGGSVFLIDSGIITGTSIVGGGQSIVYPNITGFINIDHYMSHILALNANGILTGIGANVFGESNTRDLNGVSKLSAGFSTSMAVYNDGYVTGYGTPQALDNTPNILNSGIDVQLRGHIGTILKRNQDIEQWIDPWISELPDIDEPDYLDNNIVAISQGLHFTAAIFKRLTDVVLPSATGYNCLWKVTYVGGMESYGGISLNTLYPPSGLVVQSCDGYSFYLPLITGAGQTYTQTQVTNCNVYAGTHQIDFESICSGYKLLNINYTITGYAPKTGFAAIGITTGDYWNPMLTGDLRNKTLLYADRSISPVSGGYLKLFSGRSGSFTHTDNMYSSFISGSGSNPINVSFDHFETGNYIGYFYAHGPLSGNKSTILVGKNGAVILNDSTTTGTNYNSTTFTEGIQYLTVPFTITSSSDYIYLYVNYFLNGIQFIKL